MDDSRRLDKRRRGVGVQHVRRRRRRRCRRRRPDLDRRGVVDVDVVTEAAVVVHRDASFAAKTDADDGRRHERLLQAGVGVDQDGLGVDAALPQRQVVSSELVLVLLGSERKKIR